MTSPPPRRRLSTAERRRQERLAAAEAWWALIVRVLTFLTGAGIMFWQTVVEHVDRPWLIAAATGMMGLPVANIIGRALSTNGVLPTAEDEE